MQWYDVAGPEGAPTIVLIHGAAANRHMWTAQLEGLAGDYRLVAPDLPGNGSLIGVPFTLEAAVEAIRRLLDEATVGRALVVGGSLGGFPAITFATRYPERVAGLVLAGSSLNFTGALGLYLRLVGFPLARGLGERRLRRMVEGRYRRLLPPAAAEALIGGGISVRALGEAFLAIAGVDFRRILAAYQGPLLVLNGGRDTAVRRGAAAFAGAGPGAGAR